MRIWPIGISSSNLKVFWPLWDAAILRRYGRAATPSERLLVTALAAELGQRVPVIKSQFGQVVPLRDLHRVIDEAIDAGVAVGMKLVDRVDVTEPAELDIHWPSEDPPEESRTVYVDRVIREPYPVSGEFIDILF
ncbi:MAG: hypothetical protein ACE5GE_03440 [Phycisphaerae bacterium]